MSFAVSQQEKIRFRFSPSAAAEELLRRREQERRGPLWEPFPDSPQLLAFNHPADELLYGGAAGGGKTDLLIGVALTQARRSIIFRREYRQMRGPQAIMGRARRLLASTPATWNGAELAWIGIPGGRTLEFGAVRLPDDVEKFQGRPHDFIGFDELSHFTEQQYVYLSAWNRTAMEGVRTRIIAASNPPIETAEGLWIVERWAPWLDPSHPKPALPGELRWYARDQDGAEYECEGPDDVKIIKGSDGEERQVVPRSRSFIPARVEDNPYYMATGYAKTLDSLPEPWRSALREGNFQVAFKDRPYQVIPWAWLQIAERRWGELDDASLSGPVRAIGADVSLENEKGDAATIARILPGPIIKNIEEHVPEKGSVSVTLDLADYLAGQAGSDSRCIVVIDMVGLGEGAYEQLRRRGVSVIGFGANARTTLRSMSGAYGFANWRSAMWWLMRECLDPESGYDIAVPPMTRLRAELLAARYSVTPSGLIQVEGKEELRKRLKGSTDYADAVLMGLFGSVLLTEQQQAESDSFTRRTRREYALY